MLSLQRRKLLEDGFGLLARGQRSKYGAQCDARVPLNMGSPAQIRLSQMMCSPYPFGLSAVYFMGVRSKAKLPSVVTPTQQLSSPFPLWKSPLIINIPAPHSPKPRIFPCFFALLPLHSA